MTRGQIDQGRLARLLGSRRMGTVRADAGPFGAAQTAADVSVVLAASTSVAAPLVERLDALAKLHRMTRDEVLAHALDELEASPERLLRKTG